MTTSGNSPRNREVAIFSAALELPANHRTAYLAEACADDPALRQRLEVLLRVHEDAITFLENKPPGAQDSPADPKVPTATLPLPSEKPGDRIGRYKLLQQIGEGGCGVVYMADQEEPVRRRVALKVIKLGMDTKQVIARFEAERQALALMDHPNIAKVLDAGATEAGRPYFVMELVRGVKITDYCDANNLSTRERLALFVEVCHAIQHAHQKGIIHRDIKPSNILVTVSEPGAPACSKVIDFGIAKATTGQQLTDKTVFTAFEQFIGTPAYMSPEQAMMTTSDIDTRTDIYSLGVLLYELLTGKTPLDQKELLAAGLEEMRRTIREREPARPSTRLSTMLEAELTTTAKHRHTDAPKLAHLLQGDLDWIVMKALEKERARRYETANGLAMDIQRHLNNEPVAARPPSRLYRVQKLFQRNRLAFAAAGAVIAVLTLGLCATTWALVRERAARRETEETRDLNLRSDSARNEQLTKFLLGTMKLGNSWRAKDPTLTRAGADFFSARVAVELTNQPAAQADLWLSIAAFCADMSDYRRAVTNCQRAVNAYRVAGAEHQKLALALVRLGRFQSANKDVAAGRTNAQLAVATARTSGDPETLALCLLEAAKSFNESGEPAPEGIPFLREALHLRREVVPNLLACLDSRGSLVKALQALALEGKSDEVKAILHQELKESPSDQDLLDLLRALETARPETNSRPVSQ